jgi:hypothetical protein
MNRDEIAAARHLAAWLAKTLSEDDYASEWGTAALAIDRLCNELEQRVKLTAVACPKCRTRIEITGKNDEATYEPA